MIQVTQAFLQLDHRNKLARSVSRRHIPRTHDDGFSYQRAEVGSFGTKRHGRSLSACQRLEKCH